MESAVMGEMPRKASRQIEYQFDFNKILQYSTEERVIIMDLIKSMSSGGDWETKSMLKNTLDSLGVIITKRENSLNQILS